MCCGVLVRDPTEGIGYLQALQAHTGWHLISRAPTPTFDSDTRAIRYGEVTGRTEMICPVADRNTVSESRVPALRVNVGACFSRGAPTFILSQMPLAYVESIPCGWRSGKHSPE